MVSVIFRAACLAALVSFPAPARAGSPLGGIGVLGDSYSDEYQFYAPDRSTARNWIEFLATRRGLDFGTMSDTSRGEPRNQGYAYNWARSEATSVDMIERGQLRGLAEQVARGEVRTVVIFIGGNDFIYALHASDPIARLREATPRAIANLRTAVETLLAASPDVRLVVTTVPDIRDLPEFRAPLRAGRLPRAHVEASTASIREFNLAVKLLARGRSRVALADLDLQTKLATALWGDSLRLGPKTLTRLAVGNDSDHVFLNDLRHVGTIPQALLARAIVDTLNARFGAGIDRIEDSEILAFADSLAPEPGEIARAPVAAAIPTTTATVPSVGMED